MFEPKEKITEFIEEKAESAVKKIAKTPMEKFFVFFLILISGSAVVLGFLQMRKNIYGPLEGSFFAQKSGEIRAKYQNSLAQTSAAEIAKLKSQDSDLDGIDDYSELYTYQTSPYLADTDSDGISDKEEISAGTDPNCPIGKTCQAGDYGTGSQPETSGNSNINIAGGQLDYANMDENQIADLENKILSGEVTLEQLGINDPELQKTFDNLKNTQAQTAIPSSAEKASAVQDLANMTPAQIRQELITRGLDKSMLDKIDDATLKKMFLESLKAQ